MPIQRRLPLALLGLGAALLAPSASADEVVLISDRDNTLYEHASGLLSNGAGIGMFAGSTAQATDHRRRALVHFDVAAAIPAGSIVTSVALELTVTRGISGVHDISLHRVSKDWGEGASNAGDHRDGDGAPALSGDATWRHTRYPVAFWAASGGEFEAQPSASIGVAASGLHRWSSIEMVADVQGWLDAADTNHGWLLRGDESTSRSVRRFATREASLSLRPRLSVEFCPPGHPALAQNYGAGFPGSLGVPTLVASQDPVLGADLVVHASNSRGAATPGLLILGLSPLDLPGSWGGHLLVQRWATTPLLLPASGLDLPFTVPLNAELCGVSVFAQVLEFDPGAAKGLSNTDGLELRFGS